MGFRRQIILAVGSTAILIASRNFPLQAEVFVLKSGGRIEGELLNPKRQRGDAYDVRTEEGVRLALAEANVQRVIVKSDLDKQYEELLPKLKNTVEDQWTMAEWCLEAGLGEQRMRHLRAVIELAPDHEEARKALGYRRHGSRWLTQDEYMASLGYARYKGSWRLKQEIEIESREAQRELAEKKLRKDVRNWFEQLEAGGRYADMADRNLKALDDPLAAPALAEILADKSQPRASRLRALSMISNIAPGAANGTLIRLAMDEKDESVSEACLEELKRQGPQASQAVFVAELKSKDNARVNRAAECLERVADKRATLPLINALVTEHRFVVQQGGPPGSMTTTFGNSSGGLGSGGPGGGGLAMGGKPKVVKKQFQNSSVLAALATLHPDVNFQYDAEAWRAWYVQSQTTSQVDLRRGD
jgi:hypothetical protein